MKTNKKFVALVGVTLYSIYKVALYSIP